MKKTKQLQTAFMPDSYSLGLGKAGANRSLTISGQKLDRPSKRITLNQKGLRITSAKIIRKDKSGDTDYLVSRINHLRGVEEVRLHTDQLLMPGRYRINLSYKPAGGPSAFDSKEPNRTQLPCIDEPAAWSAAKLEVIS